MMSSLKLWSYTALFCCVLGFVSIVTIEANAATNDCNILNTQSYTATSNGTIALNGFQVFKLDNGEVISFSANVPAGAKVEITYAGQKVTLDNSAGTTAKVLSGSITVSESRGFSSSGVIITVSGLVTDGTTTINFDCAGVTAPTPPDPTPTTPDPDPEPTPPAPEPTPTDPVPSPVDTGANSAATADDLISGITGQFLTPFVVPDFFDSLPEASDKNCGDLIRLVKSAAARLNAAKGFLNFGAAKIDLESANAALKAANCPEEFPATVVHLPAPIKVEPEEEPEQKDDPEQEDKIFLHNVNCDEKFAAINIATKALEAASEATNDASGKEFDAALKAQTKAESALRKAGSEYYECVRLRNLADKGVLNAIKEMNKDELRAEIEALNRQLAAQEDTLDKNEDILAADLEFGASSGTQGLSDDVDRARDNVLETQLSISLHQAALNAQSSTSNYAPLTTQTSTKRFDSVINKSRFNNQDTANGKFSNATINPTLDGNGFSSQFYTGDRSAATPWMIFLNTSGTLNGNNRPGADRTTQAWNVALGAQIKVDPSTSLGLTGTYKNATVKSKATDSKVTGDYLSLSLSANRKLFGNAALNLSGAYTRGNNDINIGGATGAFDVEIVSANASLSNSMKFDEITLATSINAAFAQVRRDSYTDSAALFVPGSTISSANFSANAAFSRTFIDIGNFASLTPSIGISANLNQREKLAATLVNGATANQLGFGASLNAALAAKFQNGVSANVSSSYGLFQDGVNNWSLSGALVFPLN